MSLSCSWNTYNQRLCKIWLILSLNFNVTQFMRLSDDLKPCLFFHSIATLKIHLPYFNFGQNYSFAWLHCEWYVSCERGGSWEKKWSQNSSRHKVPTLQERLIAGIFPDISFTDGRVTVLPRPREIDQEGHLVCTNLNLPRLLELHCCLVFTGQSSTLFRFQMCKCRLVTPVQCSDFQSLRCFN